MAVNLHIPHCSSLSHYQNINFPSISFPHNNFIFKRSNLSNAQLSSVTPLLQSNATTQQVKMSSSALTSLELQTQKLDFPIMVNGGTGKMGQAVIQAAISAGVQLIPITFSSGEVSDRVLEISGMNIRVHGPSEREGVLASAFDAHPDLIVIDYTVPDAVNENAELYCKIGVPFVMGTTGGDREKLYKTVEDSKVYAVVAFLAAMEIMAEQFPGAFTGYSLQVMESHQSSKKDTSGTKAVISAFEKLGVSFQYDQLQKIRDPKHQVQMVGVPEEYIDGHAFHMYHLQSPDETVSFEFQHNVCGRSIYAEGSVDAAIFLAKKVRLKADKLVYDMIDVLREGNMR